MSQLKFRKVQNSTGLYRYGSQEIYYARIKIHGKLIVKKLNSNALRTAEIEVSRLGSPKLPFNPNEAILRSTKMAAIPNRSKNLEHSDEGA